MGTHQTRGNLDDLYRDPVCDLAYRARSHGTNPSRHSGAPSDASFELSVLFGRFSIHTRPRPPRLRHRPLRGASSSTDNAFFEGIDDEWLVRMIPNQWPYNIPLKCRHCTASDRLEPRSFSFCAHIDHGWSTIGPSQTADRILELTGTLPRDAANKPVLDTLKVERERGLTVKPRAVSMLYTNPASRIECLPNLIDTPGHVDFAWEVSRSLAACSLALFRRVCLRVLPPSGQDHITPPDSLLRPNHHHALPQLRPQGLPPKHGWRSVLFCNPPHLRTVVGLDQWHLMSLAPDAPSVE
ncbi:unnamed protein product [Tilletia controversa]|uniref:Tr-type G domain-containing protein n=3 Tax=Tilletia TaxID=13289 RepID=A0ABN7IRS8_9BASI|nr:hypothetical protein CF328_g6265 [Tilletia controversa]CAD6897454.1 unnamed protein product [Tilletia controversa]CAD6913393.1 unnamed protein product [Tilletia caries]CAD7063213.1 unnamed protein product [Tilletia caries]